MKAVGYERPLPIDHPEALLDIDLPEPVAAGRDLLVEVKAVSVNPVDTKVRQRTGPEEGQRYKVLGWDASGVVRAVGHEVTLFKPGDRVWYAGSVSRAGSNSELHLVDERVVGRAPQSLDFAQAAALPLTAITAWEMLFDRLAIDPRRAQPGKSLLIIGAAGGVGSIMTQLAARLTPFTVIGTASRPETQAWVRESGAHHVIDHGKSLLEEMKRIGLGQADYVVSLTHTQDHLDEIVEIVAPLGRFGLIDDPPSLDATRFKRKVVSVHWEGMFARSLFGTDDMIFQHRLLNEVAELVDAGTIRTTLNECLGSIDARNLKRAHALVESGRSRGKLVLEGWR